MSDLNRRTFIRLLGQGTAALGMGMGISGRRAYAKTGVAQTASTAAKGTAGKYQVFQPGVYLDWEKAIVEERMEVVKKGPQKTSAGTTGEGMPGGGYILSSSNSIHSGVKPENYAAMMRTVREFGAY